MLRPGHLSVPLGNGLCGAEVYKCSWYGWPSFIWKRDFSVSLIVSDFSPIERELAQHPRLMMQLLLQVLPLLFASASAVAVPDISHGGHDGHDSHHGHGGPPKSFSWIPDFNNLVAFGDR